MGFVDFGFRDTRASSSVIDSGDKRLIKVTGRIRHSLSEDENKARKDFIFNRMKKSMESGRIIVYILKAQRKLEEHGSNDGSIHRFLSAARKP